MLMKDCFGDYLHPKRRRQGMEDDRRSPLDSKNGKPVLPFFLLVIYGVDDLCS
jgi:hypothetical protein